MGRPPISAGIYMTDEKKESNIIKLLRMIYEALSLSTLQKTESGLKRFSVP